MKGAFLKKHLFFFNKLIYKNNYNETLNNYTTGHYIHLFTFQTEYFQYKNTNPHTIEQKHLNKKL